MALKSIEVLDKKFNISYEIVNPTEKNDIVILHGWGSNKEIMKQAFGNLLAEFRHIYIDMPGFGKSTNDYILTTKDYSLIIKKFLEVLNTNVIAIAGHSFGGKVATLINPDNLILFSTAGILEEKSFKTKIKIFFAKLLNTFGLSRLTKVFRSDDVQKMSENMYETFKNVVNEDFSFIFESYEKKAMIFWGKADTATTLPSGEKIHKLIKNSSFKVYEGDHYFFLKHKKDICEIIKKGLR